MRPIYEKGDRVLVKFLTGFCAFVIQECEYREGEMWFYGVSCCSMMYFPSRADVTAEGVSVEPHLMTTLPARAASGGALDYITRGLARLRESAEAGASTWKRSRSPSTRIRGGCC